MCLFKMANKTHKPSVLLDAVFTAMTFALPGSPALIRIKNQYNDTPSLILTEYKVFRNHLCDFRYSFLAYSPPLNFSYDGLGDGLGFE